MKRSTLQLNGHRINYATAGNPQHPPLMMVHGWSSHIGIWESLFAEFAQDFHCVALDLIGFGDSDKPDGSHYYEIENQANLVLQLADRLGLESLTLVGHSMGGQISLLIASDLAPQRVRKVVSIAGLVSARLGPYVERLVLPLSVVGYKLPATYTLWRWLSRYRWFAPMEYKAWFYDWRKLDFEAWAVDRYMTNQPNIQFGNYHAGKAMYRMNLHSRLPKVTAPTLVVFGAQDQLVPVTDAHITAQKVPNSQLILIDQCGHFPMREQPDQLLVALRGFLRKEI